MDGALQRPDDQDEKPREVEPEIVGFDPPPQAQPLPTAWRAFLSRLTFALVLGAAGLIATLLGGALTLSIVGAFFGLPLLLIGLFLIILSLTFPLGRR